MDDNERDQDSRLIDLWLDELEHEEENEDKQFELAEREAWMLEDFYYYMNR